MGTLESTQGGELICAPHMICRCPAGESVYIGLVKGKSTTNYRRGVTPDGDAYMWLYATKGTAARRGDI